MIVILINKIISLALIMMMGWLLVKSKAMSAAASEGLSKLTLYLIMPCVILSSFQVDYSEEVKNGLLLAFLAAGGIHVLLILLNCVLTKLLHLDGVEQTSVMYSNAGNLIIPLVTAILGKNWVIYTSGFLVIQLIFLWSHGKATLCGEKGFDLRKMLSNLNMITIIIGLILFFTQMRLPELFQDTIDTVGSMIGPISMIVTGILLGGMEFRKIFAYKRIWMISLLRLIVVPLLVLPLLKFSGISALTPNGESILLVTLLAVTTPSSSTITQLAQVYGKDAKYACAVNVVTTLLCVITIPIMIQLYQL